MNIYEAINAVMSDVGVIGKNTKNTTQGFMFRGIDAVMNALQPALIKNHVFVVPEILEQKREERTSKEGKLLIYSICQVRYTFYAEDGSSISAVVIGEGMDTGDKATNKAMSIAFKYACFQVFCIPTEEMKDPDIECHEVKPKNETPIAVTSIDNKKIGASKINALTKKCEEDGVNPSVILKHYNIKDLSELTEKQFAWTCHNWTKEFVNGDKGKD